MHPNRSDELHLFKTSINLSEYAAAQGYILDRAHSSHNSVAMRGPNGDKIIIARDAGSGHWLYFSIADTQDNGTIVNFVDHRQHLSLGDIRKELRPWIGLAAPPPKHPPATAYQPEMEPIQKDRAAMLAQFGAMTPLLHGHTYLEEERHIPRTVLEAPRFTGRIYTDRYCNAVFLHHDHHGGVCGYEVRNYRFKGFARGGSKGLWHSTARPDDITLVITESAIDALSYHTLHGLEHARYCSIAGEISPLQRELLASGIQKLPEGSTIILATDQDKGGEKLAHDLRTIAASTGRENLRVIEHRPERAGDWNDALRQWPQNLPPHSTKGAPTPNPS